MNDRPADMPPTDEQLSAQLLLGQQAAEKGQIAMVKWWRPVNDPALPTMKGITTVSVGKLLAITETDLELHMGPDGTRKISREHLLAIRYVGRPEEVSQADVQRMVRGE
jgi:hypothetical protein